MRTIDSLGNILIMQVGSAGPSGFSGSSGYSAYSGYSGYSGPEGVSGYSGASTSGYSGYSGPSGFSAIAGGPGSSGYSGYSGEGTSGYSGYSGDSGGDGTSGYSGYSGDSTSGYSGYSGDSTSGYSGYSGGDGTSGYSGYSGEGTSGYSGYSGLDGADAVAGKLPNSYVELAAPVSTTSATLEDVSGMSVNITLDEAVEIAVVTSFEIATQSGASASTIGIAININGTDYDEYQRYLSGTNDFGIGAITHRSAELAPGTYTVKLRFRRVSGVATPGLNHADLLVFACQGAKGESGFSGYTGASGTSGVSGVSGYSGDSTSGYSGYSGESGAIGAAGDSGYSGYSGDSTSGYSGYSGGPSGFSGYSTTESIMIACSDETTALSTGTKATFRMPYAYTLTSVRGSVTTAATGATLLEVDINESGSSILSTELTFDAGEKTTTTATTPAVISDTGLANDAEITVDIDAVGSTVAGAGLKVYLIGSRT